MAQRRLVQLSMGEDDGEAAWRATTEEESAEKSEENQFQPDLISDILLHRKAVTVNERKLQTQVK